MIYPKFLKRFSTIGICAPSSGIGDKLDDLQHSIDTFTAHQWNVKETASVRSTLSRSTDAVYRGQELNQLFEDESVDFVMSAGGGDFLFEILPYVDWNLLASHPKWLMGASDPTSLLFTLTTKYDIATMYCCNATHFSNTEDEDVKTVLSYIQGNWTTQYSSQMHASIADFLPEYKGLDTITQWKSNKYEFSAAGRCIGGCIDVLKDLIGTEYDAVKNYVEKYKEDGIIWYFDNFSMSAENFYRTLLQMKYAGWFKYCKAVVFGRVLFPSSETGMSYQNALELAINDIPFIHEADVGHTLPSMIMVNGAIMNLSYQEGKGIIDFRKD